MTDRLAAEHGAQHAERALNLMTKMPIHELEASVQYRQVSVQHCLYVFCICGPSGKVCGPDTNVMSTMQDLSDPAGPAPRPLPDTQGSGVSVGVDFAAVSCTNLVKAYSSDVVAVF